MYLFNVTLYSGHFFSWWHRHKIFEDKNSILIRITFLPIRFWSYMNIIVLDKFLKRVGTVITKKIECESLQLYQLLTILNYCYCKLYFLQHHGYTQHTQKLGFKPFSSSWWCKALLSSQMLVRLILVFPHYIAAKPGTASLLRNIAMKQGN